MDLMYWPFYASFECALAEVIHGRPPVTILFDTHTHELKSEVFAKFLSQSIFNIARHDVPVRLFSATDGSETRTSGLHLLEIQQPPKIPMC